MRKALSSIGEAIRFRGALRGPIGPDFGLILPREGLLALLDAVGVSGSRLIDSNATGDYEVEQGHSCSFDGVMYGKLVDSAGTDTSVTLSGDFVIRIPVSITTGATDRIVIKGDTVTEGQIKLINDSSSARVRLFVGGVGQSFLNVPIVDNLLIIARTGSDVTVSSGEYSETFTLNTSPFIFRELGNTHVGNLWNLQASDSTGIVFSNPLAQQSDIGLMHSAVGPNVQLVNFPADYIHLDNRYGYTWSGYSDVENLLKWSEDLTNVLWVESNGATTQAVSEGTQITFGSNPDGRIYQVSADQNGNSVAVGVYVKSVSGTTSIRVRNHGVLSSDIEVTSEFQWIEHTVDVVSADTFIMLYNNTAGNAGDVVVSKVVEQVSTSLDTDKYTKTTYAEITGKIPQDPSNLGYDVVGNALTNPGTPQRNAKVYGYWGNFDGVAYLSLPHLTGTETVTFSSGDAVPTVGVGQVTFTVGSCGRLTLDDGTDLIIQGDSNVTGQGTCYDISGNSNHATLTNFPDPFFTVQKEGSHLLAGGFELGTELWPIPANPTTGLSALGQPLTHAPGILTPDHPVDIEMIPNVEGYEADQIAGNQYYEVDGTLKQVDAANIATNQGDTEFFGLKGIAIYTAAQVAATVTKILKYIKPFS